MEHVIRCIVNLLTQIPTHTGTKCVSEFFLTVTEWEGEVINLAILVIMRGEYDTLQPWPFRNKVTFFLLDQSCENFDVMDSFETYLDKSSSFQKLQRSMNVAVGAPLFFPLKDLNKNGYIVDDNIYFRVAAHRSNST